MRTPEVTNGERGSLGTVFLLRVISVSYTHLEEYRDSQPSEPTGNHRDSNPEGRTSSFCPYELLRTLLRLSLIHISY